MTLVQAASTVSAPLRDMMDHAVYAVRGHQRTRVPRMAGLAARLAAALAPTAANPLSAGETVRGRRLRGDRRILISQRQLTFQIGDALGLLGDLALALGQLPAQTLNLLLQAFVDVLALLSLGPRHASHSTPIRSICTDP
jgi:hypothetical protein